MRVSDFRFDLPERLIATEPAAPRDSARLLIHDRASRDSRHATVRDLPGFLAEGDLLVLNDTRVLPHRLVGRRPSGGRVEVLILDRRDDGSCTGLVKPAKKLRVGEPPWLLEDRIELVAAESGTGDSELGGGRCRFQLRDLQGGELGAALDAVGRAPLPPYIGRRGAGGPGIRAEDVAADRARYQTIFAARNGAVAAPTAGLHFTAELFEALRGRGVETTTVTLHVGEGTFAPIRVDRVEDHPMHSEWYELPESAADAVAKTRQRGGRVVAVGTTAARTLETCGVADRTVVSGSGDTDIFFYPGSGGLRIVDALLTNFHLPESTLLMLVSAFAGREEMLGLYAEAIRRGYRFYSFGDAMLLV